MQLTGADIIIECFKEQRIDTLFGYPGGTVLSVYDALYRRGEGIRHILTTHEQSAAHAADGYARATGRTGVCLVTSGPGATNLVTGIATAYMDSSPIVAVTINVPVKCLGRDSFQEIDIAGITMPVTKHNFIVKDIDELAPTLRRAFKVARSGRPGPVLVDIARDVTESVCDYVPEAICLRDEKPKISAQARKQTIKAASLLKKARRPLILAGGGCIRSNAGKELCDFATEFGIPVADTMMGKGAMNPDSPLYVGMTGEYGTGAAGYAFSNCDVLVAVGCRFSDRLIGEEGEKIPTCKIIHADIDKAEINKNLEADIAVVSDAAAFLETLKEELGKKVNGSTLPMMSDKWLKVLEKEKKADLGTKTYKPDDPLTGESVVRTVGEIAGEDAVFVTEVGECQVSAVNGLKFARPGRLLTSGGLGTMGFGLGAAIGAKAGCPGACVVNFAGDGSVRMNMCELMTAHSNNLPIIEIIFDNSSLGMVHTMQRNRYNSRYIATELDDSYSYSQIARGMGASAYECFTLKELENAFRAALADCNKNVSVIVCHI